MPFSVVYANDIVEVRQQLTGDRDVAVVCIFGNTMHAQTGWRTKLNCHTAMSWRTGLPLTRVWRTKLYCHTAIKWRSVLPSVGGQDFFLSYDLSLETVMPWTRAVM